MMAPSDAPPPAQRTEEDRILVERARGHDAEAFRELVERYQNRVFALAYRMVGSREAAEDVAREKNAGPPQVFLGPLGGLL